MTDTQAAWGQGDIHPPATGKLQQTHFFPAENPKPRFSDSEICSHLFHLA